MTTALQIDHEREINDMALAIFKREEHGEERDRAATYEELAATARTASHAHKLLPKANKIIAELIELLKSAEHELTEWNHAYPEESGNTPILLELINEGLKLADGLDRPT